MTARRTALALLSLLALSLLALAPPAHAATAVFRVNAGGPAVSGTPSWGADTAGAPSPYGNAAAAGSQVYATTAAIDMSDASVPAGTPASLFQTERWDGAGGAEMTWNFPVAAGLYVLRLYFAEIYPGAAAVGARLFNVSIEGAVKLSNFDVYAAAGSKLNRGIVRSFTVTSDATLTITFAHVKENPAVKAIEIIPASTTGGGGGTTIGFGKSTLQGAALASPTSLQVGPDGKLYVAQVNGLIKVFTLARTAANTYTVTQTQTIGLVNTIPNHNDDGSANASLATRQITGLLVAGTAAAPVVYVTSSDPRIGGGSSGTDTNLDTNSGVLSRLTWNGSAWSKVDLVRGLPRSEENHSPNGMALDPATQTLYMGVGGNTNMGAPSNNFAFLPEYALSAAVLQLSLGALGSTTYDLPTLDDENRAGTADAGDPFGGDDGKNQARLVPGGPVQVYAAGFRNPYDVVRTAAGRLYAIDNGPNAGWGDVPVGEGPGGTCTNGVHEPGVTYGDGLHFIGGLGYYAGHPNPTRANPANTFNASNPQSPVATAHAIECDFRAPGTNGALVTFPSSTDGIAEYTASNFGGAMKGNLLAAGYVYNTIYRVQLTGDGAGALATSNLFSSVGQSPLDVWAQGDGGAFPGTVWVADMGAGKIVVFEPNDYGGTSASCTGAYSTTLDEDGDGYKNADEIDNGTSPCSAADVPHDWDKDYVSDRNDPDDDNDGLGDAADRFAIDAGNGLTTKLPVSYSWNSDAPSPGKLLNLGFTGLMSNGTANYQSLYDPAKLTAGGAAGVLTVDQVPAGDAYATYNTQQYGFQLGVDARPASTGPFVVHTRLAAPFAGTTPRLGQSFGLFVGTGTQDNYVKIVAGVFGAGTGVQVLKEVTASPSESPVSPLALPGPSAVDLYLRVDPATGQVTPKYQTAGGALVTLPAVSVPTSWFGAGLAVGVIATSDGSGATFPATWDLIEAVPETAGGGGSGTTLARDTFTRSLTSSWGNADQGGAWSVVAGGGANFSVNGSRGVVALPTDGTEKIAELGAVQALDVEARADVFPSGPPASGGGLFAYLVLRRQSLGGYYRLGLYLNASGQVYVRGQASTGTYLFNDVNTGLVHAPGNGYTLRAQAQGANPTTLRVKVWRVGTAEPASWLAAAASSQAGLQTAGAVGLRAVNTGTSALSLQADNYTSTALGTVTASLGHWETRASTGLARQEVSFAQLGGKLYLTGGGTAQQIYTPGTNAWSSAAPLPANLDHIQSVALGGKVYYPGGLYAWPSPAANTLYVYDPATNTFTPGAAMPAGRGRGAGGVAVYNGKLYYAGGLAGGVAVNYFDVYDPAVNAWSALPAMPRVRDHFHAAVVNGKFYAVGGRNLAIDALVSASDAFSFAAGAWQTGLAPLPTPRGGFAAAVLGGEILVIGGEGGGGTFATVEAYDTAADTWRTLAPMPTARHGIEAAVCNGGVYVADGGTLQGDGGATQVHQVFFLGAATSCP